MLKFVGTGIVATVINLALYGGLFYFGLWALRDFGLV